MDAASAETLITEPAAAAIEPDPRTVVTPLVVDCVEELLCKYNIMDDWSTYL